MKKIVLKDGENRVFIVNEEMISYDANLNEAYDIYGNKFGAFDAEDYSLENEYSEAWKDMESEGIKRFGDIFLEIDFKEKNGTFFASNLDELELQNKETEINDFVNTWEKENKKETKSDYITYWDGHNWRTVFLNEDYGLRRIDEAEEREILSAFDDREEKKDDGECVISEANGYTFFETKYPVFYIAEVDNND